MSTKDTSINFNSFLLTGILLLSGWTLKTVYDINTTVTIAVTNLSKVMAEVARIQAWDDEHDKELKSLELSVAIHHQAAK